MRYVAGFARLLWNFEVNLFIFILFYNPNLREIIALFLKTCIECELKQGRAKKGLVIKPILSEDRNSRAQIDLIDLQSCPADDFKHILVYQVC